MINRRQFLSMTAAGGTAALLVHDAGAASVKPVSTNARVVIIGGGTAGVTVAARLKRSHAPLDVTVIEPSERHFYQPLWTLVGGGLATLAETERTHRQAFNEAFGMLRQRIDNPDQTPSAQVLEASRAHGGFFKYTMFASGHHKQALLAHPLDAETQARFELAARESLQAQQQIESQDTERFEDFVAAYYA